MNDLDLPQTIASLAARRDEAIKSINAYYITGLALLTLEVTYNGFDHKNQYINEPSRQHYKISSGPATKTLNAIPHVYQDISVSQNDLPKIEDSLIHIAHHWGAWDIVKTPYPAGIQGLLPPVLLPHHQAAGRDGYTHYRFLPMLRCSEYRTKLWKEKDITLCPYSSTRQESIKLIGFGDFGGQQIMCLGRQDTKKTSEIRIISPFITFEGAWIVIKCPYHQEVVSFLRGLRGRKYLPNQKTWHVPIRYAGIVQQNLDKLHRALGLT